MRTQRSAGVRMSGPGWSGRWMTGCQIFLLVILILIQSTAPQTTEEQLQPTAGSSVIGDDVTKDSTMDKAIAPVYKMANIFLEVIIKPTDLTELNATIDMSDFNAVFASLQTDWQTWVKHYYAYVICLVVGVIYILAVPITGCVICCCRSRGRCKRNGDKGITKKTIWARRICTVLFLLLCVGILFGVVCMFLATDQLHRHMDEAGLPKVLKDSVDRLHQFLDVARSSFNLYLSNQLIPNVDALRVKLTDLPAQVQKAVGTQTGIGPHMETLTAYTGQLEDIRDKLLTIDSTVDAINAKTTTLDSKLTELKGNITRDFSSCSTPQCQMMNNLVTTLATTADFTGVGTLAGVSSAITNVLTGSGNIYASMEQAQDVYNQIQDAVRTGAGSIITNLVAEGDKVVAEIESFLNDTLVEFQDLLPLDDLKQTVTDDVAPNIDKYGDYVYYTFMAISTAFLLVVTLYFTGLLFGACGSQAAKKTECCHKSASTSLLKAALVFMYFFACIIMIVVAVLFPVGGILHNEVCRHLRLPAPDVQSAKVMDNMVTNSFNLPISFLAVYDSCQKENSLYTALQLQTQGDNFDLDKVLNADKYNIKPLLDDVAAGTYNPGVMNIVSQQLLTNIADLRAAIDNIDLTAHSTQLGKDIVTQDLKALSEELSGIAENSTTQAELFHFYSTVTGSIHENEFSQVQTSTNILRDLVLAINIFRDKYNATEAVLLLQDVQGSATTAAVTTGVNSVTTSLKSDLETLLSDAADSVRSNVARCGPVADTVSDLLDGICAGLLQPYNAFWFSTGWCLIFFVFIIPIVVVLIDFYRMKPQYKSHSIDAASATSTTELVRNDRRRDSERSKYHGCPLPDPDSTEYRPNRGVPYEQLPVVSGARSSPVQLPRHYQNASHERSPNHGRRNERQWTNLAYDDTEERSDRDAFNWTPDHRDRNHSNSRDHYGNSRDPHSPRDPYENNTRDNYHRSNSRDDYNRHNNYDDRSRDPYNYRSDRRTIYPDDNAW